MILPPLLFHVTSINVGGHVRHAVHAVATKLSSLNLKNLDQSKVMSR